MQFSGTEEIAAPRSTVWAFLMDPNKVGGCGPGVQQIDLVDEDHFNARAKVGVGFITATFNVHMTFVERVPLERARISARGQAPGSAVDAVGEMALRDDGSGGTVMDWSADVNISGTLASVGARLIEGTAQKLIGQTFTCIKTKVAEEVPGAVAPSAPVSAPAPVPSSAPAVAPIAATAAASAPAPIAAASAAAAPAGPLEYLIRIAGPAMTNVFVIADPATGEAVVIDPAQPCRDWLTAELEARNWRLRMIIATHGHWDHIGDVAALRQWSGGSTDVAVHANDGDRLSAPSSRTAPFDLGSVQPTVYLADGQRIVVGSIELQVLHTPGHTEGSISLLTGTGGVVFTGDTLAAGSWGRTDLSGGSPVQMVESLGRLIALPDHVRVFPGHGRSTTIGRERAWMEAVVAGNRLVA